jgi:hypothetical protein
MAADELLAHVATERRRDVDVVVSAEARARVERRDL